MLLFALAAAPTAAIVLIRAAAFQQPGSVTATDRGGREGTGSLQRLEADDTTHPDRQHGLSHPVEVSGNLTRRRSG